MQTNETRGDDPLKLVPSTSSSSSGDDATLATPYEHAAGQEGWETNEEKALSDIKKLQVIIEEFGEMSTLMENVDGTPAESERIIGETHGSLYR